MNALPADHLAQEERDKDQHDHQNSVFGAADVLLVVVCKSHQFYTEISSPYFVFIPFPGLGKIPVEMEYLPVCGESAGIHGMIDGEEASGEPGVIPG